MLTPNTNIKTATYHAVYSPMETQETKKDRHNKTTHFECKNPNVRRELFPIHGILEKEDCLTNFKNKST